MRYFLDTASIEDIEYWQQFGLVHGVTTNPAILSKETGKALDHVRTVANMVNGPVSAQVTYRTSNEMIEQGHRLAKIADNIVVKIPSTLEGYKAAKELKEMGIPLNITLNFDPTQTIPFLMLNADYVSLILGRLRDFYLDGSGNTSALEKLRNVMGSKTQILLASIRNSHELMESASSGADAVTVPPTTWKNVYTNPLVLQGENDFLSAWNTLSDDQRKEYEG